MRLLDCFRAFDVERAGSLSYESLYGGLSWLGVELSPTQMLDLPNESTFRSTLSRGKNSKSLLDRTMIGKKNGKRKIA